jgi:methionyl-tRNA formyltransferase
MTAKLNLFLGSVDRVLASMSERIPVAAVVAPRGRLRNLRLQKKLVQEGTQWIEIASRADFLQAVAPFEEIGLVAVAGFSWRINADVIARSQQIVNFHPGDIFKCRGPQPLESSLINGFGNIGVTAHVIDSEEMDSGPVLHRNTAEINPDKGYSWHKHLSNDMLRAVADKVFDAVSGNQDLPPESWDVEQSTWYPREHHDVLKALYCAPRLSDFYLWLRTHQKSGLS